ncbi:hypothetical protein R1sor_011597 [Riccia sorocarpa]|uniref:WRC domain-containing protein n=1 Tax=Riccia sorocarpa TaxID=122646 RepID=A0ABD3I2F2_9MARC
MRIRKNRTSSRVVPEFCVAHDSAFHKSRGFRVLDPADFGESPQLESSSLTGNPSLDASKVDKDLTTTHDHDSLGNECTSIRIRIRDFVLAHRANARVGIGRCKNLNQQCSNENSSESPSAYQADGFRSDAERATNSSDRTSSPPSPAAVTSDKVNCDASSKATGDRRKSDDKENPAESEITRDSPQQLPTMSVTGNGNGITRRRKRHRSKMEPDSSNMPQRDGTAKSKLERDARDYACEPAEGADLEVSSGTTEKKPKVQEGRDSDVGSRDKSAVSSCFPVGWSYRGLAQIAEQDKPPQGKQCGRTDGRSWRCPLKVQEGLTLCEHHLSKFRLKKLSKESKRRKLSNRRRQRQQQRQNLDEENEEQQGPEREQDGPNSPSNHEEINIERSAQIPASKEHDIPVRSRRKKHRTVKLSVL